MGRSLFTMSQKLSESEMTTGANQHSSSASTPEEIRDNFLTSGDAGDVFRLRSRFVEQEVENAYTSLLAAVFPSGLAILAVGGYGRTELFPYSDIDICLLLESDKVVEDKRGDISAFLQRLWDANL